MTITNETTRRAAGVALLSVLPCAGLLAQSGAPTAPNVQPSTQLPVQPPVQLPVHPGAQAPAPGGVAPPPPVPVEPWEGTLTDGLAEARRLAGEEELAAAIGVLDRLLAPNAYAEWRERVRADGGFKARCASALDPIAEQLGLAGWPRELRAEVHFAKGVVALRAGDAMAADQALGAAREMAGDGSLRLDAVYDLGVLYLLIGESFRAQALEQGAGAPGTAGGMAAPPGLAPTPGQAQGPGGAAQPGVVGPDGKPLPSPIELARASYLRAREHLVERLRLDWRDEDTRANVELIQRRLKELEEQEQEQEQEQQQEQQQQQDDQQQDDQEQEDQEQEDQEDQQQEEQQDDEQQEPEEQEPQEEEPSDEEEAQEPEPQELQEIHLTREEMMRLLEKLEQIEEEKEEVKQQLYRKRRVPVKRDW